MLLSTIGVEIFLVVLEFISDMAFVMSLAHWNLNNVYTFFYMVKFASVCIILIIIIIIIIIMRHFVALLEKLVFGFDAMVNTGHDYGSASDI